MVDFFSHQLVTMRLLLLQTCTNPAMSTNELERQHIRSLLIPEQLNLFKCLEFPAVASDAPVAIFAMHDLPHEPCYSQLLPGQVKSRTTCPRRFSKLFAAGFKHSASATHDLLLRSNPCDSPRSPLAVEGVNYVGDTYCSQRRLCWRASARTDGESRSLKSTTKPFSRNFANRFRIVAASPKRKVIVASTSQRPSIVLGQI